MAQDTAMYSNMQYYNHACITVWVVAHYGHGLDFGFIVFSKSCCYCSAKYYACVYNELYLWKCIPKWDYDYHTIHSIL